MISRMAGGAEMECGYWCRREIVPDLLRMPKREGEVDDLSNSLSDAVYHQLKRMVGNIREKTLTIVVVQILLTRAVSHQNIHRHFSTLVGMVIFIFRKKWVRRAEGWYDELALSSGRNENLLTPAVYSGWVTTHEYALTTVDLLLTQSWGHQANPEYRSNTISSKRYVLKTRRSPISQIASASRP